jgi:hypothetical protein
MKFQAIAFTTGKTVLDWHAGLVGEVQKVEDWRAHVIARHAFFNTRRLKAMKRILEQVRPAYHVDGAHGEAPTREFVNICWRCYSPCCRLRSSLRCHA